MAEALDAGLALHPVHDHHQHGPGHGAVGRKPFAGYAVEERAAEHIVNAQVRPMLNSLHVLKLPAGAVHAAVAFVQGGDHGLPGFTADGAALAENAGRDQRGCGDGFALIPGVTLGGGVGVSIVVAAPGAGVGGVAHFGAGRRGDFRSVLVRHGGEGLGIALAAGAGIGHFAFLGAGGRLSLLAVAIMVAGGGGVGIRVALRRTGCRYGWYSPSRCRWAP